ncbi:isopentenyl phosphate kinase isoform X2 [Cryptomeria japonica]|uniref:isopentenyl phosphate kinase isoform X2 n=1 Tax=Cryptomeria japonica TaxID=3369 RepID=UPI0027DA00AD|nr:isopentenyl phosphate kinase isoform X2 [Cryptomeria japonica]
MFSLPLLCNCIVVFGFDITVWELQALTNGRFIKVGKGFEPSSSCGAAITCKNELEMINEENLALVSSQLRKVLMSPSSVRQTMDWSKQAGTKELIVPDNFGEQQINCDSFIVVHGAGSFGHFQASKSGVHKGGLPLSIVTAGFVATRISVTSLNLEVVRALAKDGIPAVGISPFASGWSTYKRNVENANVSEVVRIIDSGFIPGCTILSGDIIIRHLAQELKPQYVVFLTDVPGVFDRPPTEANSVLLKEIVVKEDGSWSVVKPLLPHMNNAVQTTTVAHDTTGGMATKIFEAAVIAKIGIDVYIVQAGTDHSWRALKGELPKTEEDNWIGTIVRSSQSVTI